MSTPTPERREGRRKRLDTPVRILQPGPLDTLVGTTCNISEQGMFVRMDHPLSRDAELICDICLPEPQATLPVRGRVVWVQHQPTPGIGVKFIELSEQDRLRLAQICARDTGEPVKVWLETLTHPIRARVTPTHDGVMLAARLPFLRLLSSVVVYPAQQPADSFSGTLDAVTLQPGEHSIPELRLHLSCPSPRPATDTRVAVPITPQEHAGGAAGEFVARRWPTVKIEQEPAVVAPEEQLLDIDEQPFTMEPLAASDEDDAASTWTLPAPPSSSHWRLRSDEVKAAAAARPRSRRHLGLWLAAIAMVSVTVGSMVYTRSWSRAWNWTRTRLAAATPPSAPTIVRRETPPPAAKPVQRETAPPAAARPGPRSEPSDSALVATPVVRKGPLEALAHVGPRPRSMTPTPHVVRQGGTRTLVVPIRGNTKDAVHYRLANPDGLVVNLPGARPRGRFGNYPLGERPFRMIWLRRRNGGLHLRVLFSGSLPAYRLKIRDTAIQVVLEKDTEQTR